jgi:hypothetical protein
MGIAQERLSGGLIGRDAIAGQERFGLAAGKPVALGRLGQTLLLLAPELAQAQSRIDGQPPPVYPSGQFRVEPMGQGQSTLDPGFLATQQVCDGVDRQAVGLGQRGDHARLVHGTGRLARVVGLQEPRFHRDAGGEFDDDGNLAPAFHDPEGQPLEAVEDLVGAVARGGDAKRHRRERAVPVRTLAAQRRERRLEPRDRHEVHRVVSASGSSW